MKGRVIVGLSGGVDSAVAALLLKQQGWEVTALFMKNWEEDDSAEYCSAAEDLRDATAVAEHLDIPLQTVNFSGEYWDQVFEHFLNEYRAGRTPNPDVLCNREIKFKAFLDYAIELGADYIATGHYARVNHSDSSATLHMAADEEKDQTYFLYMVGEQQFKRSLFPLGDFIKTEVRQMAKEAGLANHQRKDSTGICFIGERRFTDFLSTYLPANPGIIVTADGEELGQHQGLMYYTLGQRRGIGIGGKKDGEEQPWFVVDKDLENNRLIVAQGHNHPLLMSPSLTVGQLHWINAAPSEDILNIRARIRHRQTLQSCCLTPESEIGHYRVSFDQPQRAVTPGQSIVFYQGDQCLGGGIIEQRH